MKSPVRSAVLVIYSLVFCLTLFFHFFQRSNGIASTPQMQETVLAIETERAGLSLPSRLIIPSINVDAAIENLSLTSDGEMDVPKNINNVGWFAIGPYPGQMGSAVIAGHLNDDYGQAAIFKDLSKLKPGDLVFVENNLGTVISFIVRAKNSYVPGYAEEVFSSNNGEHLNLITCGGVWDEVKRGYSERLVVFTDMIHQ